MRKASFMICLLSLLMLLLSCEDNKRSCSQDYYMLSTKDFSMPTLAVYEIQDYLDRFSKADCGYIEDAKKMQREFSEMEDFFGKSRTLIQWCEDVKRVPFPKSSYESVRVTWDGYYRELNHKYFQSAVDKITTSSFRDYLRKYAMSMCEERWSGGAFSEWTVSNCEEIELGPLSKLNNVYAKKCEGIYTVHLEKGLLGTRKASAKVKVEGELFYAADGSMNFKRINFEVLQINGKLD